MTTLEGIAELANDLDAQRKIITEAYASDGHVVIDDALANIAQTRRMRSTGVLDWVTSYQDNDDGG
jgi:hypothetical protein